VCYFYPVGNQDNDSFKVGVPMLHSPRTVEIPNDQLLLKKLLLALLILNMGDMISTIWGVETGLLIEANPMLHWLMERGMVLFVLVKTALCVQFVITALFLSKKIKQCANQFAILTSVLVLVYFAIVVRTVGLLI
jgi:hypothetical protein